MGKKAFMAAIIPSILLILLTAQVQTTFSQTIQLPYTNLHSDLNVISPSSGAMVIDDTVPFKIVAVMDEYVRLDSLDIIDSSTGQKVGSLSLQSTETGSIPFEGTTLIDCRVSVLGGTLLNVGYGSHVYFVSGTYYWTSWDPKLVQPPNAPSSGTYPVNTTVSFVRRIISNVSTTVSITQVPDVSYYGEPVHFRVKIDPRPPTQTETFSNYTITVNLPDNTTQTISTDAYNSTISFAAGENVIDNYLNLTSQVGNYTIKVDFLGQGFHNGVYYMQSQNETTLQILAHTQPEPISPTPEATNPPSQTPSVSVPEFPTWIALPIIATTTLLTALLIRRKRQ